MKVGFIGSGAMSAASWRAACCATGWTCSVLDLDEGLVAGVRRARRQGRGGSPAAMMRACDVVITCLPSPAASAAVVAAMLPEMGPGKTWMEMSTTDADEVLRLGALVAETGGLAVECPVSGGCHRADTGNIAILRGRPARRGRACDAAARASGSADPAHGRSRLGLEAQGDDQLPGHREPAVALRGADHDEGRRGSTWPRHTRRSGFPRAIPLSTRRKAS